LRDAGLQPLTARDVPPNDGSISLGQAWVAQQLLLTPKTRLEAVF
jgi:hydrogenase maturation protein HypF